MDTNQHLQYTFIFTATSLMMILGYVFYSRKKQLPQKSDTTMSEDDVLNFTNIDILSETTSLNVSMDSDQCLMNENEEILRYWDYRILKWNELKNWLGEECEVKSISSSMIFSAISKSKQIPWE